MTVRAILEWDEETKSYSATCPELNFVSSFGETREEALSNLRKAIRLMLEPIPERRVPPPSIVGKGKTLGDIVSPIVSDEDWECLK